jgi:uncharacterized membrane protein
LDAQLPAYLLDWASLLLRWAHFIVGIAWIGASFYFIWLDDHLEPSKDPRLAGELWAVHGGGFYHAHKYRVAPDTLPETLHWFKWEAYWTWITGFALLVLLYYANPEVYLLDKSVLDISGAAAIALGAGSLVAGWLIYDLLCKSPLGRDDRALGAVMLVLLAAAAWGYCNVFGGRAAFIHYGTLLGTIMVANVAMVIIPGQKELVRARQQGREPEPKFGLAGKQRSVHNTYFTLPVLLVMISNHYVVTWGTRHAWLVLVALSLAGALIRVWFVIRHQQCAPVWLLVAALALIAACIAALAPRAAPSAGKASFAEVRAVIEARCAGCHAERPTFQGFAQPPLGVMLDTAERIRLQAAAIHKQTVAARAMPPGNLTAMTDEDRALLERWFRSGAKSD